MQLYPALPIGSSDRAFIFGMGVVGDGITMLAPWQLVILETPG